MSGQSSSIYSQRARNGTNSFRSAFRAEITVPFLNSGLIVDRAAGPLRSQGLYLLWINELDGMLGKQRGKLHAQGRRRAAYRCLVIGGDHNPEYIHFRGPDFAQSNETVAC
jgi:hypothetical protein